MKTIRFNAMAGLLMAILFSGKVYAQTGDACNYPDILSGKTFRPGTPIYSPGWEPSTNYTHTWENGKLSLYLGDETFDAWQSQFFLSISPVVSLIPGEAYCISFDIESNVDLPRVFLKFYKKGNNERFIELAGRAVRKGRQNVSGTYINEGNTTVTEIDELLFDFGYNPAGASIVISNITIRGKKDPTDNEPLPKNEIHVFPNPVKDKLHLSGLSLTAGRIKILNISGQVCLDILPNKEFDVSSLRPGIYFVMAENKVFKIIKQ
ncbi:MAG: T9SS type A sorting domain-containing protein [Tannerella sp.]|jgi:hypothetical protein|nr:T9SS type A sorting domain-containing protein [Tannerella sp.]